MTKTKPYREELFQWIWQHLEFNCSNLKTACGKPLQIIDTGEWNHGAGPDFLGAHLQVDGRDWFGSVEIHKKPADWYLHQHHFDEGFNSVVLHVVYELAQTEIVKTKDGHNPFALALKPYITKKLHRLLDAKQQRGIACSGNLSFINQRAFEKQVEAAHREYLEYKIGELLEVYDPSQPLSVAWKNCLITGIYKTLGIPANKSQMVELAQTAVQTCGISSDVYTFIEEITGLAFSPDNNISWVRRGMRPASRPKPRVKQAAVLHHAILQYSFKEFFTNDPDSSWKNLFSAIAPSLLPGSSRMSLAWQTVYLPALYLLGDLLHSTPLKKQALNKWQSPAQHVPEEMIKPFRQAGFTINKSANVIGLAHQYKRYCREKNCHRCEVFKKAIRS